MVVYIYMYVSMYVCMVLLFLLVAPVCDLGTDISIPGSLAVKFCHVPPVQQAQPGEALLGAQHPWNLGRSCSSWICMNLPVYGGNWDPLDGHSSSLWLSRRKLAQPHVLGVMLKSWGGG